MLVTFDLETAQSWDKDTPIRSQMKELGISCGAVLKDGCANQLWYDQVEGKIAPRMSKAWAAELLAALYAHHAAGDTVVTWNGMFDFQLLGTVAEAEREAAVLCKKHVDLMLLFLSIKGFPLGLKAAANACHSHKGAGGIDDGAMAPELWARGEHELVLSYVAQDVQATLDVAKYLVNNRGFSWTSRSGRLNHFNLPWGTALHQFTVGEVMQWPEPDQSWMNNPLTRAELTDWMFAAIGDGEEDEHA